MSVGQWFVTLLIGFIPVINLVMYFVWGFGDSAGNVNRRSFSRAMLIWFGILVVTGILVALVAPSTV